MGYEIKRRIFKSALSSIFVSIAIYFCIFGVFYSLYRFSPAGSYNHIKSSQVMLKMGYAFPLKGVRNVVLEEPQSDLLYDVLFYSEQYDFDMEYTVDEWEKLMFSGPLKTANKIAGYLYKKNIEIH